MIEETTAPPKIWTKGRIRPEATAAPHSCDDSEEAEQKQHNPRRYSRQPTDWVPTPGTEKRSIGALTSTAALAAWPVSTRLSRHRFARAASACDQGEITLRCRREEPLPNSVEKQR